VRRAQALTKQGRAGGFPTRVMFFDTETHPADDEGHQELTLWTAVHQRTERAGSKISEAQGSTIQSFWDIVEANVPAGHKLTLMAYNTAFDLRVMRFEEELVRRGWKFTSLCAPKPFRLTAVKGSQRLEILDLGNWWGYIGLKKIGEDVGLSKGEIPGGPADERYHQCRPGSQDWDVLMEYCMNDSHVGLVAFNKWVAFCQEHELGPFAGTQAGQALSAYRWRFLKPGHIFLHDNPRAMALERESYHGGLVDCFRIGEYTNTQFPFHKVDVNSMFPHKMATLQLPRKYVAYRQGTIGEWDDATSTPATRLTELAGWLKQEAVTARVTVNTDLSDRPASVKCFCCLLNEDGKLYMPEGQFETVLTTRELQRGLDLGIIEDCTELVAYEQDILFDGYVGFFHDLKQQYEREGNEAWRSICKIFLNGLYGKFGQHHEDWVKTDIEPVGNIEVFVDEDGERTTVRKVGNLWDQSNGIKHDSTYSFCAIAAHITADARLHLVDLRNAAGADHAYYCDTDSLIVDEDGMLMLTLAGYMGPRLGQLKDEGTATEISILAPKCYTFGGEVKRKGVRKNAVNLGGGRYQQPQFQGFLGSLRAGDLNSVKVTEIVKIMSFQYTKGELNDQGWVRPHRIGEKYGIRTCGKQVSPV
jgi:DNA polymerase family B